MPETIQAKRNLIVRLERTTNCGGFTLVELLTAAGIIIVLLAVLLPTVSRQRQATLSAKCASNLRQLGTALVVFATDNRGYLPPTITQEGVLGPDRGGRVWHQYLSHGDPATYTGEGVLPNPNKTNDPTLLTVYNCPANPDRAGKWGDPSYAYNRSMGDLTMDPATTTRVHLSSFEEPSKVVVIVDAGIRTLKSTPPHTLCYATGLTGNFEWQRSVHFGLHPGERANILMVDGHVESLTSEQVKERIASKQLLWRRNNIPGAAGDW